MSGILSEILRDIQLPPMIRVRQRFSHPSLESARIPAIINQQLADEAFAARIRPGMRIAVTAGSRGIANIALITKTVTDFVKNRGGEPFVVPAMGSHGGAVAEGQLAVLEHLGITEAYLGCPIIATMDVTCIGRTEAGYEVWTDSAAAAADGIIVVGRIKAHTDFTGPYESGIMKMMAIGLGNHVGASICHGLGFKDFHQHIPAFGKAVLARLPILFAIAILENAHDATAKIEAILPEAIAHREPPLLLEAKQMMAKLFLDDYDILVVDQIGKDISGCGMDPHVTGAFCTPYAYGAKRPQRIAVLDLTEKTNGNALGVGDADATTKRLWQKTVLEEGYPNGVIAHVLSSCKIPIIMESDKEAIQVCIKTCENIDPNRIRLIRIRDTSHLEHIMISEALLEEAKSNPLVEIESGPIDWPFDAGGNLW